MVNTTCLFIPELGVAAYAVSVLFPLLYFTTLAIYAVITDLKKRRRRRSFFIGHDFTPG